MERVFGGLLLVLFVISLFAGPALMRLPSQKKRYQQMDDRRLVGLHVQARMGKWTSRGLAYALPIPLVLLLVLESMANVRTVFLVIAVFFVLAGHTTAAVFRELELQTATEMEFRKLQAERAVSAGPAEKARDAGAE